MPRHNKQGHRGKNKYFLRRQRRRKHRRNARGRKPEQVAAERAKGD